MKFWLSVFFIFGLFPGIRVFGFPQAVRWVNTPIVVFDNKKQAVLTPNLWLKSPFAVVTASHDQFEFKLNDLDSIVVYPNSKVQIVDFLNETGFVSDFYILGGEIRFASTYRSLSKNEAFVTVKTPFFELPTAGVYDIVIKLDMNEPSVEVKVISGVLPLRFFAFEKTPNLKAGERVKFTGVIADEGGGIKYDYLLNNRKIPKGTLSAVTKFDPAEFFKADKKFVESEKDKKLAIKRKKEEAIKKQKAYEATFLCQKPFAQKDQCAWWLDAGKCYRKRCNVSGQWGDLIERPVTELCKKEFSVAVCDY